MSNNDFFFTFFIIVIIFLPLSLMMYYVLPKFWVRVKKTTPRRAIIGAIIIISLIILAIRIIGPIAAGIIIGLIVIWLILIGFFWYSFLELRHAGIDIKPYIILIIVLFLIWFYVVAILPGPGAPYLTLNFSEIDNNLLQVRVQTSFTSDPIPNASIGIYVHGAQTLLVGPRYSNESGITILEIPQGYKDFFDIRVESENYQLTATFDHRFFLIQWYDYLGPLGIAIIGAIFAVIGYLAKLSIDEYRNKKKSNPEKGTGSLQAPPPGYG